MAKASAGILMYRVSRTVSGTDVSVLLVHPGGPYWRAREAGAWSIPKGEIDPGEDPSAAAVREFQEELGSAPGEPLIPLGEIVQRGGKRVIAYAVAGEFDAATLRSNTFEMEWPPRSGRMQVFPEVDRAAWLSLPRAHEKILESQRPLLDRLAQLLKG
ncbi:NUDIX hydrolase [Bordetella genomosp. 8]|uniref:NUDIX hydrolase n=1 Tax=Bordetella genomosp. 8 TaxID=1416806 RepID=A0A1W6YNF0_9BORD|nr:NUDIX domain-containing protein [Bordetella genomosp. 8]ARP82558.1 NUDIX hydrolase [Bordetella genomosp. 8]